MLDSGAKDYLKSVFAENAKILLYINDVNIYTLLLL